MLRKIGLIVCAWTLAWTLGTGVYADTTTKVNTANTIEILKPEVGSEGDVILKKDTLYVNLRLSGKSVVYMSLYRIDPEFSLGSQVQTDLAFVSAADYGTLTNAELVYVKKNRLETAYSASRTEYNALLAQVKVEFGDVAKMDALKAAGGLNAAQLTLADRYHRVYTLNAQNKKDYAAVKAQYNKLFERLVFGPTEVNPTDILLTYQTEIQGVTPGTYVLTFSEKADGSQIIKTLEFKGGTAEKAVEEMLVPENRIKLFTGPTL